MGLIDFFAQKWIIFASVFCLGGRQLLCQASFFVSKIWTILEITIVSYLTCSKTNRSQVILIVRTLSLRQTQLHKIGLNGIRLSSAVDMISSSQRRGLSLKPHIMHVWIYIRERRGPHMLHRLTVNSFSTL